MMMPIDSSFEGPVVTPKDASEHLKAARLAARRTFMAAGGANAIQQQPANPPAENVNNAAEDDNNVAAMHP